MHFFNLMVMFWTYNMGYPLIIFFENLTRGTTHLKCTYFVSNGICGKHEYIPIINTHVNYTSF